MAAAQMGGVRLAQAPEEDDPINALSARNAGERGGSRALAGHEVLGTAAAHRMNQVIGDIDPAGDSAQR
jgi:hypothetical protein